MQIPEGHKAWFEEVCKRCELEDSATAVKEGGFVLNDIPFLFVQGAVGEDTHLLVQAIIGTLPQAGGMEILRRVLELQLIMAGPNTPVFGLEPSSNGIALIQTVAPGETAPEAAAILLRATAKTIERLRDTLFKGGPVATKSALHKQMIAALKNDEQAG